MKKIILFILILIPWFIGGLIFKFDSLFYESLNLPFFTLPNNLISISWFIIYILIAISIFIIINNENILKNRDYMYIIITNYIANMVFPLFFFTLRSPFLGFVISLIIFVTSVYLYYETKKIKKEASYFLIPYVIFSLYATILSMFVYFMNF